MDITTLAIAKKFAKEYTDTHASKLTEEDAVRAVANYFNENPNAIVTNDELEIILNQYIKQEELSNLKPQINQLNQDITTKITAPATASIGQTIRVKTADESGKPTEWEAADMATAERVERLAEEVGKRLSSLTEEIADLPQPDWDQNDDTQLDYIKNRPFYTGDPVETVLVEESTVMFGKQQDADFYMGNFQSTFEATVGETYKISYDGTVYECICVFFNEALVIGNLSIIGAGSDTGEPFLIIVLNGEGMLIITADTSASHTFSISKMVAPVVKIDPKYLPDTLLSSRPVGKSCLTFSSPNSFTLEVEGATKHWDGILEYSTDASTWSTWDSTTPLSSATSGSYNVLYLRGTGNTKICHYDENMNDYTPWVINGIDVRCDGNIETLLDYATVESGAHPIMATGCYYQMFCDCTALTQAPALPATTLATNCYSSMFQSCIALTQAPALPATTLATGCYRNMFNGCTFLPRVPALPATTLADYCYTGMFNGCTALTQAPALPATTLADYCYSQMFFNCKALTQAPALPATTLANNCYSQMFQGCTSLTRVPALPATTLAQDCYRSMFYKCTNLKLSSTQTNEYPQEYCIPSSGTGTTATDALTGMFSSTGGTFIGAPKINTTYYLSSDNMIVRETEIATLNGYVGSMIDFTIGKGQFKPKGKSYLTFSSPNSFTLKVNDTTKHWNGTLEYFASDRTWTTWDGTTTLSSVDNDGEHVLYLRGTGNTVITGTSNSYRWVLTGSDISCIGNIENLLDYATVEPSNHPTMASFCYSYMFYGCTSLIQAPALPATTLTMACYSSMFYKCSALTQAPSLPATTLAQHCYSNMFYSCRNLTQAPALPAMGLANYCYTSMFNDCTSLTQTPALHATTLAEHCYQSMFRNCTSLTRVPALLATTLAIQCYDSMFLGCTSLTQVPVLPATTLANGCYQHMFDGCTSLKLSSSKTDEYTQEYRIPSFGTGTTVNNALTNMFVSTGGTFAGTPEINTTYYFSTDNMIVRETEMATLNEYVRAMINQALAALPNGDEVSY